MAIVKTNLGAEITNLDEALQNYAAFKYTSGIYRKKLNECLPFLVASNIIGIKTGELCISGFRVQIDEQETFSFTTPPVVDTNYEIIAKITVSELVVTFNLFYRVPAVLQDDNIFSTGSGSYELKLATFTHTTDNEILNLTKTAGFVGD